MVAGLPVGLQIIGKALDESGVMRIGHAFEQSTNWHTLRSPVAQMEPSAVSHQPSAGSQPFGATTTENAMTTQPTD
jgi:aspartyl-tRNA(Asn)/glutamyl-tRNA(Gln) amidotransferase subunit A